MKTDLSGTGPVAGNSIAFASVTQINFVVPPDSAIGKAAVSEGMFQGTRQIQTVAPALFSAAGNGLGPAAAVAIRSGDPHADSERRAGVLMHRCLSELSGGAARSRRGCAAHVGVLWRRTPRRQPVGHPGHHRGPALPNLVRRPDGNNDIDQTRAWPDTSPAFGTNSPIELAN
jgi:hypothetical protein